jgi:hypothetical protein
VSTWAGGGSYEPGAVSQFLQVADYYLVAHALAKGFDVVTHEVAANSVTNQLAAVPTIGLLRVMSPVDPSKLASPKLKTPPSEATSQ